MICFSYCPAVTRININLLPWVFARETSAGATDLRNRTARPSYKGWNTMFLLAIGVVGFEPTGNPTKRTFCRQSPYSIKPIIAILKSDFLSTLGRWNGAYTIRTCTTFLLDRLATYSDTITAMHHITACHGQSLQWKSNWVEFHIHRKKVYWEFALIRWTIDGLIAGDGFEPPFSRVWTLRDSASPSCDVHIWKNHFSTFTYCLL